MNKLLIAGLCATLLVAIAGAWTFLAPFIIRYQGVSQTWKVATRNDLWTGGGLLLIGFAIAALVTINSIQDAIRLSQRRRADLAAREINQDSGTL